MQTITNKNRPGLHYVTDGLFTGQAADTGVRFLWSSFGKEGYTGSAGSLLSDNGEDITGKFWDDRPYNNVLSWMTDRYDVEGSVSGDDNVSDFHAMMGVWRHRFVLYLYLHFAKK